MSVILCCTVIVGSPGEPAGLYVESNSIQGTSLKLVWTWTPAMGHGFPVLFFRVEAYTEFDRTWEIVSEGKHKSQYAGLTGNHFSCFRCVTLKRA